MGVRLAKVSSFHSCGNCGNCRRGDEFMAMEAASNAGSESSVSSFLFSKNTNKEGQVSIYILFAGGRPFGPGTPAYRRTRFIAGRLSFVPAMA